jgi:hypothetical protein
LRLASSLFVITIILGTGAYVSAQSQELPAFEFRGHHIGERIQEKFPYWSLGHQDREPYCSTDFPDNTIKCFSDPALVRDDKYLGVVKINQLTCEFVNKRLQRIDLDFDSASDQEIREMLIRKYDRPSIEYTKPSYTMVNQYEDVISEWRFKEGVLIFTLITQSRKVEAALMEFNVYANIKQNQNATP